MIQYVYLGIFDGVWVRNDFSFTKFNHADLHRFHGFASATTRYPTFYGDQTIWNDLKQFKQSKRLGTI